MRLASLFVGGRKILAARRGDGFIDLGGLSPALPGELGAALARFGGDLAPLRAAVEAAPASAVIARDQVRFAPPIADGAKVLCLGLNFVDHASEAAYAKPEYPVVFSRFPASFAGHDEPLELPSVSSRFDYEAELVVVIGRRGRHISRDAALSHVAGYTLMNDGSVRDFQTRTPQWTLGKNFDRSGALGPEIVTADELPPGARGLALRGRLNGAVMQHATTSDMVFDVATTIAYISIAMALEAGDLIAMGTPAGVGHTRNPPVFMKDGDTFEIEVEGVGTLRNSVRAELI
jgi:2-keto-4-pentenoate hydratase/2-oxohepta-3-ene-1,7-dioic acid hydratase in catechol pathway